MGTWGTGLYADDTACDVRDSYVGHLKSGLDDDEAREAVLARFGNLLDDAEVACLVYFALADTQWRYGRLDAKVKRHALGLIEHGGDLHVWERDAPADLGARKRVLSALKRRLESPQAARRLVKVRTLTPLRKRTDAAHGTVFLLPLSDQSCAALVLVGHCDTGYKTMEPVFSVLKWRGTSPPDAAALSRLGVLAIEGGGLGPATEIGFFGTNARVNPIADFRRTSTVLESATPYGGQGNFTSKWAMIERIEAALRAAGI